MVSEKNNLSSFLGNLSWFTNGELMTTLLLQASFVGLAIFYFSRQFYRCSLAWFDNFLVFDWLLFLLGVCVYDAF